MVGVPDFTVPRRPGSRPVSCPTRTRHSGSPLPLSDSNDDRSTNDLTGTPWERWLPLPSGEREDCEDARVGPRPSSVVTRVTETYWPLPHASPPFHPDPLFHRFLSNRGLGTSGPRFSRGVWETKGYLDLTTLLSFLVPHSTLPDWVRVCYRPDLRDQVHVDHGYSFKDSVVAGST